MVSASRGAFEINVVSIGSCPKTDIEIKNIIYKNVFIAN
jgi:Ni,Fe-hydrogenase III small subunit